MLLCGIGMFFKQLSNFLGMEENSHNLISLLSKDQHPIWLSVLLHVFPGMLAMVVYIPMAKLFWDYDLPVIFALYSVIVFILIPFEYGLIRYLSRKKVSIPHNLNHKWTLPSILRNIHKTPTLGLILFSLLALFWTVFIMGVLDKQLGVSVWIYENWFSWFPEYLDMAGVYTHPDQYSPGVLILLLSLTLIFGAILGPFIEEIYFRGFLLPRMVNNTWVSPVLNAILFAFYHLWTPWMVPMRILALLPMILLVWWKKDVKIGIYSHIGLNLLGDVILVIPIFFN